LFCWGGEHATIVLFTLPIPSKEKLVTDVAQEPKTIKGEECGAEEALGQEEVYSQKRPAWLFLNVGTLISMTTKAFL
jgi:hypothetical protein